MNFFMVAMLVGLLGAAPVFVGNKSGRFTAFFFLTVFYTLAGWWIIYGGLPSVAMPMFVPMSIMLLFWWIISSLAGGLIEGEGDDMCWSHAFWLPIAYIVVLIITALSGWGLFRADGYAKLIGDVNTKTAKHWSQEIQPLDPTHIRLVPQELAISLAKTTLSMDGMTLGSQFPLDSAHITLQKIKDQYWYLIPLDYKAWNVWTNADYVPGYVKISATDPFAKPLLITGKKFKYTPDAFFSDYLDRMIYWKYMDKVLTDYSFEEDDKGNVFWVITVKHPSISFWGDIVDGVVIFNPENGENEFVSKKEVNANTKYAWVDRVMPVEVIKTYINEWGNFSGGWWNQFWNHINLLKAETPTLNYSIDGRCVIVTPITSTNDADGAMTGLMYTDARTGVSTYYAVSGGASEQLVIEAVNSAVSYKKWHASKQIVYENIYGKLSAIIPVMGENGNYQGLAIVENENKRVAFGTTPQEALINYQKVLMNSGGQITTESIKDSREYTGVISRLGWELAGTNIEKQYYICFKDFKNSFMVGSNSQSELALTREGDTVTIRYIVSDQSAVPVISFKNLTLNLQSSKNEQAVKAEVSGRTEENQVKADVIDFREEIKGMSDDELKKMMDAKK